MLGFLCEISDLGGSAIGYLTKTFTAETPSTQRRRREFQTKPVASRSDKRCSEYRRESGSDEAEKEPDDIWLGMRDYSADHYQCSQVIGVVIREQECFAQDRLAGAVRNFSEQIGREI